MPDTLDYASPADRPVERRNWWVLLVAGWPIILCGGTLCGFFGNSIGAVLAVWGGLLALVPAWALIHYLRSRKTKKPD